MTITDETVKFILQIWPGIVLSMIVGFVLIVTGRIVLRRQHDEIVTYWKDLAAKSTDQITKMLDNDDITHSLLRSVLKKAEEKDTD